MQPKLMRWFCSAYRVQKQTVKQLVNGTDANELVRCDIPLRDEVFGTKVVGVWLGMQLWSQREGKENAR